MLYVVNVIIVLLGVAVLVGGMLYRRRVVRKIDDPPPWAKHCYATRTGNLDYVISSSAKYGATLETNR